MLLAYLAVPFSSAVFLIACCVQQAVLLYYLAAFTSIGELCE
jgi:hypothetical protein